MIDIDRRNLIAIALLAPLAAGGTGASAQQNEAHSAHMYMPDSTVHWEGNEQIAMLIYPGMTVMDLIGPHCMFGSLMGAKIHLVSKTPEPVTSDAGVTIVPTATFETCPRDLTVLFAPGGTDGTLAAATDPATLTFMADRGARANYVTSVCSGSLILGAAGLLKGYKATSHWSCRDALAGFGAIPTDARVVRDRNRVTGAGVTAGLDFGLMMIAELRSRFYAECTQLVSEYDPRPPFHAGSMKTAPEKVKADMIELLSGFSKQAAQLSSRTKQS
ncbi:DJ-1/PfpI family protein [Paraburkholderia bannensis]|uniref:DJ-1/PfpI family protein n=1 Tax=Paraburkholderia bannensis TaxID=765414 RepID=UPI0004836970|nr:DJ-1/PfpI family protein [Paraburkholderia bannensis]